MVTHDSRPGPPPSSHHPEAIRRATAGDVIAATDVRPEVPDGLDGLDGLDGMTAGDVMLRYPKTMPVNASLVDARAAFASDRIHLLLLTDGPRLVGTLVRDDLPPPVGPTGDAARHGAGDVSPALRYAVLRGRTVSAAVPAEEAWQRLLARGQRRLAVIDTDATLLGLLCLTRRGTGFCSDAHIAARAAPRTARLAGVAPRRLSR